LNNTQKFIIKLYKNFEGLALKKVFTNIPNYRQSLQIIHSMTIVKNMKIYLFKTQLIITFFISFFSFSEQELTPFDTGVKMFIDGEVITKEDIKEGLYVGRCIYVTSPQYIKGSALLIQKTKDHDPVFGETFKVSFKYSTSNTDPTFYDNWLTKLPKRSSFLPNIKDTTKVLIDSTVKQPFAGVIDDSPYPKEFRNKYGDIALSNRTTENIITQYTARNTITLFKEAKSVDNKKLLVSFQLNFRHGQPDQVCIYFERHDIKDIYDPKP